MAGSRIPGPIGLSDGAQSREDGTLIRARSPLPGVVGSQSESWCDPLFGDALCRVKPHSLLTGDRGRQNSAAEPSVTDWTLEQKFSTALQLTLPKLPATMQREFAALISPASIGVTVGVLIVWAGSHAFGVGQIIDIVLLLAGVIFLGFAAIDVAGHLSEFIKLTCAAKTKSDLDDAASHLAYVISVIGVAALTALLAKGATKAKAPPPPERKPRERVTEGRNTKGQQTADVGGAPSGTRTPQETNTAVAAGARVEPLRTKPPGKPQLMEPHTPKCFKPGDELRKNWKGDPKKLEKEFYEQLKGQEAGINRLTVGEYLENRSRYAKVKRAGTGAAQEEARENLAGEISASIIQSLEKDGIVGQPAKQLATKKTEEIMSTLAALHEPDMGIGGPDPGLDPAGKPLRMSNTNVNSSLGAQWAARGQGRIPKMDVAAEQALKQYGPDAKMNVRLQRCKA
jgi:hypothetical protein